MLSTVKLSGTKGTKTVLVNNLAEPTTAAIHAGSAWVVEGQLSYSCGVPGEPTLPFHDRRAFVE